MSELLRFFKDMRDNGYGLAEIAAQLGTSAIAEPVAGFAAMYDPQHGADAIREGMTYQPRTQEAQEYSQSVGNAAKTAIKPAMPIIDTWKKGVDIAGQYSPVVGAGLRTVPTAIGIAMGAKPALQAGRQMSEGLGAMQGRMIANANMPNTINNGYRNQRGVFAGINALTADKEALAKAQQMIAQGVDPAQVWKETGWGKGVDGKWRFEINDSGSSLNMMNFPEAGDAGITSYLPEFLKHPQVYQNYPESKTMGVLAKNGYGDSQMRGGINGLMVVNSAGGDTAKSTVLHELQHAIQQREGFARGGSPEQFKKTQLDLEKEKWASIVNQTVNDGESIDSVLSQLKKEVLDRGINDSTYSHNDFNAVLTLIQSKEPKALIEKWIKDGQVENNPHESYRSLAGEVEARTTQSRMDLNAQQRRENYPFDYKTYGYDVPAKSQTVDFGNNKAMSQRPLTEFEQAHLTAQQRGQRGAIGTLSTDDDLRALARFNQMDDVYKFDNSHEYYDSIDKLVARNLSDDSFDFMELPTSYGKMSITPSAKEQGKWQVTQWAKDGNPLSDSGNLTKEKALRVFFEDSRPELLSPPKRPLTEFEQAHLLAQQRAALPVNQMGLDLPANNTAMDRARAMGWDVDAFTGVNTTGEIDSMLPKSWFSEQSKYASDYSNVIPKSGIDAEPRVYPVILKTGNVKAKKYTGLYDDMESALSKKRTDTFKVENVGGGNNNFYVIKDPKNIRSRFAAFDPFNRDSSDLLAQSAKLAPTTALGAYMYNEKRKKSQGNQ